MFCIQCGSKLEDGSVFCHVCGSKVIQPEELEQENVSTESAPPSPTTENVFVNSTVKASDGNNNDSAPPQSEVVISKQGSKATVEINNDPTHSDVSPVSQHSQPTPSSSLPTQTVNTAQRKKSKLPWVFAGAGAIAVIAIIAVVAVQMILNQETYQETYADMWAVLPYIDETPASDFDYEITDEYGGGVMIMGYNGDSDAVRIPETLDGKPVLYVNVSKNALKELILPDTVIQAHCDGRSLEYINIPFENVYIPFDEIKFFKYLPLKAVYISNNAKQIGEYAFLNCSSLTSITIPESVTEIGEYAFYGCTGLTSITIPESVTEIDDYAFYGCTGLTSITIPSSVIEIGRRAFNDCTGLTSVTISDGVAGIRGDVFDGCTSLTAIYLPDSVEYAHHAFTDSNLKSIIYKGNTYDVLEFDSLFNGMDMWIHDGVLRYANVPIYDTSVIIPNNVTKIGDSVFMECSWLTSITIPETVTEIGGFAFANCSSLTSITIPKNVTEIGERAFLNCSSLTSIIIPDSISKIGDGAFTYCPGLTSITIPENVTEIGEEAFMDCSGLTSIIIPDSVTKIGREAFWGCTGLTSITISSSVTEIGYRAFWDCTSLTSIIIPENVSKIGGEAFSGCTGLTSITIPDSVTKIGDYAFDACPNVTIKCTSGSYAEQYAKENNISYQLI